MTYISVVIYAYRKWLNLHFYKNDKLLIFAKIQFIAVVKSTIWVKIVCVYQNHKIVNHSEERSVSIKIAKTLEGTCMC